MIIIEQLLFAGGHLSMSDFFPQKKYLELELASLFPSVDSLQQLAVSLSLNQLFTEMCTLFRCHKINPIYLCILVKQGNNILESGEMEVEQTSSWLLQQEKTKGGAAFSPKLGFHYDCLHALSPGCMCAHSVLSWTRSQHYFI